MRVEFEYIEHGINKNLGSLSNFFQLVHILSSLILLMGRRRRNKFVINKINFVKVNKFVIKIF